MGYATVNELQTRWRSLEPAEQATAGTLLEDASTQLRREIPDLTTRVNAGDLELLQVAKRVVCAMVKRAMAVADDAYGVTSTQETQGPFSRSFNYSNPMGDLYLTRAEKRLLGGGRQQAYIIDQVPDPTANLGTWP